MSCASTILEMYQKRSEPDETVTPVKSKSWKAVIQGQSEGVFAPLMLSRKPPVARGLLPPKTFDPRLRRPSKSVVRLALPGQRANTNTPAKATVGGGGGGVGGGGVKAATAAAAKAAKEMKMAAASKTTAKNQVRRGSRLESSRSVASTKSQLASPARTLEPPGSNRSDKTADKTANSNQEAAGAGSGGGGGGGGATDREGKNRKKSLVIPPPALVTFMKTSKKSAAQKAKVTTGALPEGVSGCVGGIAGFQNWPKREQYTDKDRAAAVIIGDTDIKTTLEKQLKSDRGRYVLPKESPAQVYLAQAEFEMRIGGWTIALQLLQKVPARFIELELLALSILSIGLIGMGRQTRVTKHKKRRRDCFLLEASEDM